MQNRFFRNYVYFLVIALVLAFFTDLLRRNIEHFAVSLLSSVVGFIRFGLFVTSIVLFFYLRSNKFDKIYGRLPALLIFRDIGFSIFVIVTSLTETYEYSLTKPHSIAAYVIFTSISVYSIWLGVQLLNRKEKIQPKKDKKDNKSRTLGIVAIVVGAISFIPLIGFFLGPVAAILGFIDYRNNKDKFGIIGLSLGIIGLLISAGLYGGIFYFGLVHRGGVFDEMRVDSVKTQLPQTVNLIEAYKVRFGEYPESIEDLTKITESLSIVDELQVIGFEKRDPYFYYEKIGDGYYLFSKGIDGKEFTDDDIFPEIEETSSDIGYRKP